MTAALVLLAFAVGAAAGFVVGQKRERRALRAAQALAADPVVRSVVQATRRHPLTFGVPERRA